MWLYNHTIITKPLITVFIDQLCENGSKLFYLLSKISSNTVYVNIEMRH